jgi:hypothetical protein
VFAVPRSIAISDEKKPSSLDLKNIIAPSILSKRFLAWNFFVF